MEEKNPDKPTLVKTLSATVRSVKSKPAIYLPFVLFSVLEIITLILLFSAPRMPLRSILGPPIKAFFGEKFLHYPANFLLLPLLISRASMALSIVIGSLLTGMAVAILYNKPVKAAVKRYAALFLLVFSIILIYHFSIKAVNSGLARYFIRGHAKLLFLGPRLWLGPILMAINIIVPVFIQMIFAYTIPELIKNNAGFFKAVYKSLVFFIKNLKLTFFLVSLPMLLYFPILLLNQNTPFLISNFSPESVLLVSMLGVIVTTLIIDPLITVSTAIVYNREEL